MDAPLTSSNKQPEKKFLSGIFSKEDQAISLIGEGISVVGTLNVQDNVLRLDGRLEGKIIGQGTLIMGEKGVLQGEIHVSRLILGGRVEGRVTAQEGIHITPTGKLFGTALTSQLIIDEGGIFEGESKSLQPEESVAGSS
jgi:cytoskeletal protein CcmA (bactofilin family)